MKGRAKARQEMIVILAHQTEAMARQKKLEPLSQYLDRPKRKGTDAGVFAALERAQAKGLVTIKERMH